MSIYVGCLYAWPATARLAQYHIWGGFSLFFIFLSWWFCFRVSLCQGESASRSCLSGFLFFFSEIVELSAILSFYFLGDRQDCFSQNR